MQHVLVNPNFSQVAANVNWANPKRNPLIHAASQNGAILVRVKNPNFN
jgi:hypothetical protein